MHFLAIIPELSEYPAIKALLIVLIGLSIVIIASRAAGRTARKKLTPHLALLLQKAIFYVGILLVISTALIEMNVNLTAVLGAAGILTVAIGFAAQTSLSNLISGLFLLGEKPFQVGDLVVVNGTRGTVVSIDLLSVKMRTPDNLFIRIPNETIIKTEVTNITRFPIRRMDINVGVSYNEDSKKVMALLREIADSNPFSLDEPEPLVLFKDFGPSSLDFLLGVWFEKTNFLKLKNSIMPEIKARFDVEGIEIAFPHLTVYAGKTTDPFPLRMDGKAADEPILEVPAPPPASPEKN